MTVKRYNIYANNEIIERHKSNEVEHPNGEWIKYHDHAEKIEALRAKVRELEAYAALGRWALEVSRDDWTDVDAGDLQDKAQELGVLISVTVTEPCCDNCQCADFGDFPAQCLRMVPLPGDNTAQQ